MSQSRLHLIKLSVGSENVDDMQEWRERSARMRVQAGLSNHSFHTTRMWPRREAELLEGGSLYWVVKGVILVRQQIHGFEEVKGADNIRRCNILLEPEIILTTPQPRRPFQGWRYLKEADAPADISKHSDQSTPELSLELADLGLL